MFKCCFPGCPYETEHRALIDFHHIHLRELGSRLGSDVAIPLCPTHHKLIYHPEATSGQHSRKFAQSMVVKQVTDSTNGKCVIFEVYESNRAPSTKPANMPKGPPCSSPRNPPIHFPIAI